MGLIQLNQLEFVLDIIMGFSCFTLSGGLLYV